MKKKIALLLTTCLIFTGCGGSKSETPSPNEPEKTETSAEEPETDSSEENTESELEALGEVEVEKELFDVNITVPAEYVDGATQEELDASAAEIGYKVVLNEDGSATYTMTKSQHRKLMAEMSNSINESLAEMVGSEDYPNITDISANSDFTEFTVTTKNTEPDLAESFAVMGFYLYGGMYHIFNGTTVDNIHVDYVNADSGEVISSSDSSDWAENKETTPDISGRDLPEGNYEDAGDGTMYISTPGGTSEDGSVPVIYASKDDIFKQIDVNTRDFDGSLLSYVYVDGTLITKDQLAFTQITIELVDSALSVGVHKVEVVQYTNNDSNGEIVTYKSASYEIQSK